MTYNPNKPPRAHVPEKDKPVKSYSQEEKDLALRNISDAFSGRLVGSDTEDTTGNYMEAESGEQTAHSHELMSTSSKIEHATSSAFPSFGRSAIDDSPMVRPEALPEFYQNLQSEQNSKEEPSFVRLTELPTMSSKETLKSGLQSLLVEADSNNNDPEYTKEFKNKLTVLLDSYNKSNPVKENEKNSEVEALPKANPRAKDIDSKKYIAGLYLQDSESITKRPDSHVIVRNAVEHAKRSERANVENERTSMQSAENAYITAYKEFHLKNNAMQRMYLKHAGNHAEVNKLNTLKETYDKSRLDYAKKLQESVHDRLQDKLEYKSKNEVRTQIDKDGKEVKYTIKGNRTQEETTKLLERYNASIRFREIVKPAMEKKQQARLEAAASKEKGILGTFAKGVKWGHGHISKFNHSITEKMEESLVGVKIGKHEITKEQAKAIVKNGSRAARILATTAAFTTAGVLSGGVGYGVAGLYAGQKILRAVGSIAYRGTVGAGVGAGSGVVYQATGGKKASEKLGKANRSDIHTLDDLDKLEFANKHGSKEAIARKRALIETAGTAVPTLILFGFSAEHAHELAAHHAVQVAANNLNHLGNGTHTVPSTSTEMTWGPGFKNMPNEPHHGIPPAETHRMLDHEKPVAHEHHEHHAHHIHHAAKHTSHHHYEHSPRADAGQNEHVEAAASTASASETPTITTAPESSAGDSADSEKIIQETYAYEQAHGHLPTGTDLNDENDILQKIHEQADPTTSHTISATPAAPIHEDIPVADHSADVSDSHDVPTASHSEVPPLDSHTEGTPTGSVYEHSEVPSVETAYHSPVWAEYKGNSSMGAFDAPAAPGSPEEGLKNNLVDILRKSGVGPQENESIQTYVTRAEAVLAHGNPSPVQILETSDHHLITQGGDQAAQFSLAKVYSFENSTPEKPIHVFVANTDPLNKSYIDISSRTPVGFGDVERIDTIKFSAIKIGTTKVIY
jgi:hypothetical protein